MPKHKSYHPATFKFDTRALKRERKYVRVQRPKPISSSETGEALTGLVNGEEASDIEERFARALDKAGFGYEFLPVIIAPANMAGSIQLDFLVYAGELYPIQIDGDWIHSTAEAKAHDLLQDALTDQWYASQGQGAQPSQRILGHRLATQDMADSVVRELF